MPSVIVPANVVLAPLAPTTHVTALVALVAPCSLVDAPPLSEPRFTVAVPAVRRAAVDKPRLKLAEELPLAPSALSRMLPVDPEKSSVPRKLVRSPARVRLPVEVVFTASVTVL